MPPVYDDNSYCYYCNMDTPEWKWYCNMCVYFAPKIMYPTAINWVTITFPLWLLLFCNLPP